MLKSWKFLDKLNFLAFVCVRRVFTWWRTFHLNFKENLNQYKEKVSQAISSLHSSSFANYDRDVMYCCWINNFPPQLILLLFTMKRRRRKIEKSKIFPLFIVCLLTKSINMTILSDVAKKKTRTRSKRILEVFSRIISSWCICQTIFSPSRAEKRKFFLNRRRFFHFI